MPLYVTWIVPSSALVMEPRVPVTPGPPVGLVPAGTVRAGQFVRQPPTLQALVPEPAVSFENVYRVIWLDAATRNVPWLASDFVITTGPGVGVGAGVGDAADWLPPHPARIAVAPMTRSRSIAGRILISFSLGI